MYANREFILNAIDYLTGGEDFMSTRTRSVKLRKLDIMRVNEQRTFYQVINIIVPLVILALAGIAIVWLRRRRYI